MEVEIFDALDVAEVASPEVSEESMAIIEKMGLAGQKSLMKKSEDGHIVDRLPFRKATTLEVWVYSALCPEQTKLTSYSEDPIPHRVLERAAYAEGSGMFTKGLYVWHQAGSIKDPVLVGYNEDGSYWNRSSAFILARWGAELDELSTLVEKARVHVADRIRRELQALEPELAALLERAKRGLLTDEELGIDRGSPQSVSRYLLH